MSSLSDTSSSVEVNGGQLQDFTIDQFAGALALTLGSVGGLLMIIWKSRCMCKMNCCYLFQCERRPPSDDKDSEEEEQGPAAQANLLREERRNNPQVGLNTGEVLVPPEREEGLDEDAVQPPNPAP